MININQFNNIYFLGIGGNALCPIAQWCLWNGKKVLGYDKVKSKNTDILENAGAIIDFSENIPQEIIDNPKDVLVFYTPALGNSTPESCEIFKKLKAMDITFAKRHDFFQYLTSKHTTVAVAGTHGKTSTTALIANILHKSSLKAISFVGGVLKEFETGFLKNCSPNDQYIVNIEADEYDRFFLCINYDVGVVTTADSDHLDFYKTEDNFKQAFLEFIENSHHESGKIYLHKEVNKNLGTSNLRKSVYSLTAAPIYAKNIEMKNHEIHFTYVNDEKQCSLNSKLPLSGLQQIENCCAAISIAIDLGVSLDEIADAMESYGGVERRFSFIANDSDKIFIDDFAHHPIEICALINSVKNLYPDKKILAIFQPHTYTRTRDYLPGFVEQLSRVDKLILLPIFAAREADVYGISSKNIVDLVNVKEKRLINSMDELKCCLKEFQPFDIILTIGAGNIFSVTKDCILEFL